MQKTTNPEHYKKTGVETFDILYDTYPNNPVMWQVGKYVLRAPFKGKYESDVEKALWYLLHELKNLYGCDADEIARDDLAKMVVGIIYREVDNNGEP